MDDAFQAHRGPCHIFATIDRHLASIHLLVRQLAAL
jgi:hypothetical protein